MLGRLTESSTPAAKQWHAVTLLGTVLKDAVTR
jgi:hypothetical protein